MTHESIIAGLNDTLTFLTEYGQFFLSPDDKHNFIVDAEELLIAAEKPGEVLYVGILGGTGVGKSTLINALAGEVISHSSDRRPFTDRAVVYRHEDTPRGLEQLSEYMRPEDATHRTAAIRNLILLDLPDFDSVQQANRQTCSEMEPFLDAIVWVLSPEKYANRNFYEFAEQLGALKENWVFVLNKADELIDVGADDPYLQLKDVVGDLHFNLRKRLNILEPKLFYFSALQAFEQNQTYPDLAAEFMRFHAFLMGRRDAKEVAGMKFRVLAGRFARLLNTLNGQIAPEQKESEIQKLKGALTTELLPSSDVPTYTQPTIDALIAALFNTLVRRDGSVAPVKLAMRLLARIRPRAGAALEVRDPQRIFQEIADDFVHLRTAHHRDFFSRVNTEVGFTLGGREAGSPFMESNEALANVVLAAKTHAVRRIEAASVRLGHSRAARILQILTLLLPAPFLIMRLASIHTLGMTNVGVGSLLRMLVNLGVATFGIEGLVALGAFFVWESLITLYLGSRRYRKIEKVARAIAERSLKDLDAEVSATLNALHANRREVLEKVERGLKLLKRLPA